MKSKLDLVTYYVFSHLVSYALGSPVPVPTNSFPSIIITSPRGTESTLPFLAPTLNDPPPSATWSELLQDWEEAERSTPVVSKPTYVQPTLQERKRNVRLIKIKNRRNHISPEPLLFKEEEKPNVSGIDKSLSSAVTPRRPNVITTTREMTLAGGNFGGRRNRHNIPKITITAPKESLSTPQTRSLSGVEAQEQLWETQWKPAVDRPLKEGEIRMDDGRIFPFVGISGSLKNTIPGHREAREEAVAELKRRKKLREAIESAVFRSTPNIPDKRAGQSKWKPKIRTIPEEDEGQSESNSMVQQNPTPARLSDDIAELDIDAQLAEKKRKRRLRRHLKQVFSQDKSPGSQSKFAFDSPSKTKFGASPDIRNVQKAGNSVSMLHSLVPTASYALLDIRDDERFGKGLRQETDEDLQKPKSRSNAEATQFLRRGRSPHYTSTARPGDTVPSISSGMNGDQGTGNLEASIDKIYDSTIEAKEKVCRATTPSIPGGRILV